MAWEPAPAPTGTEQAPVRQVLQTPTATFQEGDARGSRASVLSQRKKPRAGWRRRAVPHENQNLVFYSLARPGKGQCPDLWLRRVSGTWNTEKFV